MDYQDSYWKQVAKHHIASRRLYKVDVVIHTEDVDDIAFWRIVIAHVHADKKVKFISSDNNESGNRVTGKSHCLKYIPYLCPHFLLCIDSDFDYLLGNDNICSHEYIIHTHTYSWENHYCYINGLQRMWEQKVSCNFRFDCFLSQISPLLYDALIKLLVVKANNGRQFSLDALCSAILSVKLNKAALSNNGATYIINMEKSIHSLTADIDIDDRTIEAYKAKYAALGMHEDNAYLYMQGHCVYDMILRIGTFLTDQSIDFKNQILSQTLMFDEYPEIKSVQNHLAQVLNLL